MELNKDKIVEIINNAFIKKINHLYNSLNNTREKGKIHFKQKAIDKLEAIKTEVIKEICEEYDNEVNEMLEDMAKEYEYRIETGLGKTNDKVDS